MNPRLEKEQIHRILQGLIGGDIVAKADGEGPTRYRLTDDGSEELEETGLFEAGDTLKHYYRAVE